MFAMGGYTGYLPSGTRNLLTARPDPIKQSPRWPPGRMRAEAARAVGDRAAVSGLWPPAGQDQLRSELAIGAGQ
jgi:hypothetical protein